MFALLLIALLAVFLLVGCGTSKGNDVTGTDSSTATTKGNGVTGTGSSTATTNGNGVTGTKKATTSKSTASGGASTTSTNTTHTARTDTTYPNTVYNRVTNTATTQNRVLRPASYGQMLRNAQVHDTDGNLRDYENSVTPGTAY